MDRGPAMQEPPERPGEVGMRPSGFRMPEGMRLGPVVLQVADADRSVEFYRAVLGLTAGAGGASDEVALVAEDGVPLVLLRERPGAAPVPRRGRPGLYHFALLLADRASLGSLLAHLGRLGVRPGMADHDVSEALYLNDPDGHGIEIYVDRPRVSWRRNGREIHMTTAPLDVASLLEDGTEPWSAMPAGTTMGHVHLHVGDLGLADAYYHGALGLDRIVWSYPGALFLSAGGYHHHLGLNVWAASADPAASDDARLLEWRIVLPTAVDLAAAARSLRDGGYTVAEEGDGWVSEDTWKTRLHVSAETGGEG